jgi:hypothetical protein
MAGRCIPRPILLAAALAVASPPAGAAERSRGERPDPGGPAKVQRSDEQAMAALREMSATLASARTLRFQVQSLLPIQMAGGEWITLVGAGSVLREGTDRLFVETGGDLYPFRFYFDGKTVTAFAPEHNLYARKEAPGTIDEVLDRARSGGEITFAFADLVSADPYASMTKGLRSAALVGTSTIDGVETEHLAVHGKDLDWEMWIGTKDRLPRMVTLTDVRDARKPTHTLLLSRWELDPAVPGDAFRFEAPADAIEVPFRSPGQMAAARVPPNRARR